MLMELDDILKQIRFCGANARRNLYMTCDRDAADGWAAASRRWMFVLELKLWQLEIREPLKITDAPTAGIAGLPRC